MSVLVFRDVSFNYCSNDQELLVLDKLSFELKEGEILAIVGPSGCGKSTILNLISGLLKPTSGKVIVNGKIGYMFQKDHLFEWRSIYKNVILGLEINKDLTKENINRVNRMLKAYGLEDFKDNHPSELSGGMRQRIALIRTLAISPDLLLLDEAFASLDYQTKLLVGEDVYKIIKNEKKTTILVTHDISEAISMADKILILSSRPARVKNIFNIDFDIPGGRTPIKARKSPLFKEYFDKCWGEINGMQD